MENGLKPGGKNEHLFERDLDASNRTRLWGWGQHLNFMMLALLIVQMLAREVLLCLQGENLFLQLAAHGWLGWWLVLSSTERAVTKPLRPGSRAEVKQGSGTLPDSCFLVSWDWLGL